MGQLIDLTGKKFGRLLVLSRAPNDPKKGAYWNCLCDCGKRVVVKSASLIGKKTVSCGCYNRERASELMTKDLTGQKFGRLTALYNTRIKHGNCYLWHCLCECGKEVDVTTNDLMMSHVRSCGCLFHKDLLGKRFGRLVVMYKTDKRSESNVVWHCKCDCGNECDIASANLLSGATQSCGCLRIERIKETNTRWKTDEESKIANVLHDIKQRCYNGNDVSYPTYGDHGVYVYHPWLEDSNEFVSWMLRHGYEQGLTIDRYPDQRGPYAPWNCRLVDMKKQGNNRSSNRILTIDGIDHTVSEWADIARVDPNKLWGRSDDHILKVLRNSQYFDTSNLRKNQLDIDREISRIQKEILESIDDPFLAKAYDL